MRRKPRRSPVLAPLSEPPSDRRRHSRRRRRHRGARQTRRQGRGSRQGDAHRTAWHERARARRDALVRGSDRRAGGDGPRLRDRGAGRSRSLRRGAPKLEAAGDVTEETDLHTRHQSRWLVPFALSRRARVSSSAALRRSAAAFSCQATSVHARARYDLLEHRHASLPHRLCAADDRFDA